MKTSLIDLNIMKFFLDHDFAKSFYEISEKSEDVEHRSLYGKKIKQYIEEGVAYKEGDVIKMHISKMPEAAKVGLKVLIKKHSAELKRGANLSETHSVKKKTLDEDLEKIKADKNTLELLEAMLESLGFTDSN